MFKSSRKPGALPNPPSLLNCSQQLALPQLRSRSVDRYSPSLGGGNLPALRLNSKKFLMKGGKLCKVTKPSESKPTSRSRLILGKLVAPRNKSAEVSKSPEVKTTRSVKRVSFKADTPTVNFPGKENENPVCPDFKPAPPKRSPSVPERSFLRQCPARVDTVQNSYVPCRFYKRLQNSDALIDVEKVVTKDEVSSLKAFLPETCRKERTGGTPGTSASSPASGVEECRE